MYCVYCVYCVCHINVAVVLLCSQYAMQQHKHIVPLLTEHGYSPRGWLGLLLGSKMYFDVSEEEKVDVSLAGLRKELQRHVPDNICCCSNPPPQRFLVGFEAFPFCF